MAFESAIAFWIIVSVCAADTNYFTFGRSGSTGKKFHCPSEGYHPDPDDCRIFYRCVDWNSNAFFRDSPAPVLAAFQFSCAEGTVFDPEFNICNHPSETSRKECGGRADKDPNNEYPYTYPPLASGENRYPNEGHNQNGYPSYPPPYEVTTHNPDSHQHGGYPNESENQVNPEVDPLESAADCTSEGFFPVQGDCNKFVRCTDNGMGGYRKFVFRCGEGTVWDQQNLVCNYPSAVPGCGGTGAGHPTGDGGQNENQNGQGGYPANEMQGGQGGYPEQEYQEGYPGQGSGPDESGHQQPGGSYPSGGYPGSGNRPPVSGYPQQGNQQGYPPQQPGQTGYPQQGGQGGYPGQQAGQNNQPNQSGYPQGPTQTGYPQGGRPDQSSYPQQGQSNQPSQSGYPQGGNRPNQSGYYPQQGNQGGYPSQENRPGQSGYPQQGQGGYPGQGTRPSSGAPSQGGYPGQGGSPAEGSQGNRPQPGHQPGSQGSYPNEPSSYPQGGYPSNRPPQQGQGTGPGDSNQPGQSGYPESNPNQGGYPGDQGSYPQGGYPDSQGNSQGPDEGMGGDGSNYPSENGDGSGVPNGNPSECQSDGFFGVQGDCMRFYRCVDNGKGGYFRYDFVCGPGTVWDQEVLTCNHPWAVQRQDCSSGSTTESSMDTSRSTTMQQTTSNQQWSQTSSQTTSSFTQSSSSSSTSSSSYSNSSTTSSSTSQSQQTSSSSQNQMTSSSQSQSTSNQQSGSSSFGQQTSMQGQTATTPMRPENRPTTMKPPTGSSGSQTTAPPGSSPCRPDPNSPIKCEKAGFYPVPGNCKKFYRCVDWDGDKGERFSVYYFECGEGTIWDPALETCNHEESVYPPRDCSGGNASSNSSKPSTDETPGMTDTSELTTPGQTDGTTGMPEDTRPTGSGSGTTTDESTTTTPQGIDSTTSATAVTDPNEATTPPDTTPGATMTTTGSSQTNNPTDAGETMTPSETTDATTDGDVDESTQTPDSSNESPNQTDPNCPVLGEGQVAFVCPTGFRRHPKDCNLFYQCTISKEGDVNVMTLSCKNQTVYDERKIQCLPPDETDPCPSNSGRTRSARKIEPEMTSVVPVASSKSLCPEEGHFPYQGDCQRFFKCQRDQSGRMQGYLYQCPEKYSFSETSGRCERSSTLPKCSRSLQSLTPLSLKWMTSKVPIENLFISR